VNAHELANVILSAASLLAFWALIFFGFRAYRVDRMRERLFRLRDELFAYAAAGKISFQHPAYVMLRLTINGFMRFADRVGILTVVPMELLFRTSAGREQERELHREWIAATATLSVPVRKRLKSFRNEIHLIVLEHIFTSPVLLLLVFPLLFVIALRFARERISSWTQRTLQPVFEHADSAALLEGREALKLAA
jgi:hypothetical protein